MFNETGDGSVQGFEGAAQCALEVGETIEEEDVVTTATKQVLDRITGQRLDSVGVEKARDMRGA